MAVGATQLTVTSNQYGRETGWSFPAPRTLSPSYPDTGTWTNQSGGFNGGTYGTVTAGADSKAEWTTTIESSDGGYAGNFVEISATWVASMANTPERRLRNL